jgi:hypothetical protein
MLMQLHGSFRLRLWSPTNSRFTRVPSLQRRGGDRRTGVSASAGTPRRSVRWQTHRVGPIPGPPQRRPASPAPAGRTKGAEDGEDKADEQDLERQLWAATETIREAVLRLQRVDILPPVIVLAVARMAGEMGADAALEGGEDVENLLADLAKVMREAGLEHHALLQREGLPLTGHA